MEVECVLLLKFVTQTGLQIVSFGGSLNVLKFEEANKAFVKEFENLWQDHYFEFILKWEVIAKNFVDPN